MVVYGKESYDIVGAAFEVYNKLGHGFLEAVYQECLEIEFKKRGIPYEREKDIKIFYDGIELTQSYRADFVCYDKMSPLEKVFNTNLIFLFDGFYLTFQTVHSIVC